MTDNIGSMSLRELQNYDFINNGDDLISKGDIKALLEKPGRASLDDQGKLTMVNPDAKPDRGIVRFFKGLFSQTYRAEQRVLDRAEVLAHNQSFNKRLTTSFLKYCDPAKPFGQELSKNDTFSIRSIALAARSPVSGEQPVNFQELKQLIDSTAVRYSSSIAEASQAVFKENFTHSGVIYQGKAMTAVDFAGALLARNPDGQQLPDLKAVSLALVKHCAFHSDLMQALLPKADGDRMRTLLSEPKAGAEQRTELSQLAQKALNSLADKLNVMAQSALDRGAEPQKVAELINKALWAIGRGNADSLNSRIFDVNAQGSVAHDLSVLPGGSEEAKEISAETKARIDAVKEQFPGLDDVKAAKINTVCDYFGVDVKEYAELAATFKEAVQAAVHFGAASGSYDAYREASDKLQEALGTYVKAHPSGNLSGVDDRIKMGAIAMFHLMLNGEQSNFTPRFVNLGPDVKESLDEVVFSDNPQYSMMNEGSQHRMASLSHFMGSVLLIASSMLNGTSGASYKPAELADELLSLGHIDELKEPKGQEMLNQSVADVEPRYQQGMKNYLEGALMDKIVSSHRPASAQDLESFKQRALADPKFMTLLQAQQEPFGEQEEAKIRGFLEQDPKWGLANSLAGSLAKQSSFDADGFHDVFDADVKRHLFTEISGQKAGNDAAAVREMFRAIVPQDFIPAMSTLCMQGGLLASLSTMISFPELVGDTDHYNLTTLASTYNSAISMPHSTQLRREGEVLYLSSQLELRAAGMKGGEVFGRNGVSVEVAINLRDGVDEHGVPKSISIVSLGREPVRR